MDEEKNHQQKHDDYGRELEAYLTGRLRICPSASVAYAMADPDAKASVREALEARTREALTALIADLFWEQAAERFAGAVNRQEVMCQAEELALDFLVRNPTLWREHGLDPEKLAEAIAEQMP